MILNMSDPLAPTLVWKKRPENVLVIKKLGANLANPFIDIIIHLLYTLRLNVYIEKAEYENETLRSHTRLKVAIESDQKCVRLFSLIDDGPSKIDFVVCLGGDGTLIHASSLFQSNCPPVISIHGGSLGFLCPFEFENFKNYLNGVVKGNVPILYRNRLKFSLENANNSQNIERSTIEERPIECLALNEIIISRGCNSYLCNLDLYINDYLVTTVQGDGLIVSTPTGSTAYAMAAGASMCHPSVQAVIIAPICPHSLSFRPIVVPFGVELKIALNVEARSSEVWCSVDGNTPPGRLTRAHFVRISASQYPLPFICRSDQVNEWFEGLAACLHWNDRPRQLPLNSGFISKSRSPSRSRSHSSFSSASTSSLSSSKPNLQVPNGTAANDNTEAEATDSCETVSIRVPHEYNKLF